MLTSKFPGIYYSTVCVIIMSVLKGIIVRQEKNEHKMIKIILKDTVARV